MSDDKIASALGLKPLSEVIDKNEETSTELVVQEPADIVPAVVENSETIQDIEQARSNIKNIITHGDDALKEMMSLAKQSESPRAFEVASTLMKTLLDANKDFVEMSMKKKYEVDAINAPKEAAQTNVVNNNLILSTTDLLKMIKGE
jgi:3-methyladenine DNA glycosylase Tag